MLMGIVEGYTNPAWRNYNVALVSEGARVSSFTTFGTVVLDAIGFVSSALCSLNLLAVDSKWVS